MDLKVNCDLRKEAFNLEKDHFKDIENAIREESSSSIEAHWRRFNVYRLSTYQVALVLWVIASQFACAIAQSGDALNAGPIYDRFSLTLDSGTRTEWMGPLFYQEQVGETTGWGIPPLVTWTKDVGTDSAELDILYPLLTYDRFGTETRWQLFQWLNFSGNQSIDESDKRRFTLFPFYFQQRSANPTNNYTALVPLYGHLENRFFRDEVHFVLMPLYVQSRKREMITQNFVYPFFHLRHGPGLSGWQFWPVIGVEHKQVTQSTNHWETVEESPGYQKFFFAWPLFFKERVGIGTTNELRSLAFVPFFSVERSPLRDSIGFPWPLGFRHTEDREKDYREWDAPWPLVVFARGKGKRTDRIWPLYSKASTTVIETGFYAWPLYKWNQVHAAPYERESRKVVFYLYSELTERNTDTLQTLHRVSSWPLFTYRKDFRGRERLQILSLLEPFVPTSKSVERDFSPVWSLWRSEFNPETRASSQSLFWNLYRRERAPTAKKCSLLFGLFQYQTGPDGKRLRLFYLPVSRTKPVEPAPTTEKRDSVQSQH